MGRIAGPSYGAQAGVDPTPSFGQDTLIQQGNAAAILKTIWEGIAAYTSSVNGAEASNYTIKVLQAGAQVNAQVIAGLGTLFPIGFYDGTPANTICGVAVGDVGTGIRKFVGGSRLAVDVLGTECAYFNPAGGNCSLEMQGTFSSVLFGGDCSVARSVDATSAQANLSVIGKFGAAVTDVVIGADGVLANTAVGGFLQMPTCAGVPTGAPKLNVGKGAIIVGNTGAAAHIYFNFGAGWIVV